MQDVTPGSPADRAGVQVDDVIVGLDDLVCLATDDRLIRGRSLVRAPGTSARVRFVRRGLTRDGHA